MLWEWTPLRQKLKDQNYVAPMFGLHTLAPEVERPKLWSWRVESLSHASFAKLASLKHQFLDERALQNSVPSNTTPVHAPKSWKAKNMWPQCLVFWRQARFAKLKLSMSFSMSSIPPSYFLVLQSWSFARACQCPLFQVQCTKSPGPKAWVTKWGGSAHILFTL